MLIKCELVDEEYYQKIEEKYRSLSKEHLSKSLNNLGNDISFCYNNNKNYESL
jgi:hypothetical protein